MIPPIYFYDAHKNVKKCLALQLLCVQVRISVTQTHTARHLSVNCIHIYLTGNSMMGVNRKKRIVVVSKATDYYLQ